MSVPGLTGLRLTTAQTRLAAEQLCAQIVEVPGDPGLQGVVLDQSPAGGQTILQGSAVTLRVGSGPLPVVPDVVGQFRAAAQQALRASGFAATVVYDGATGTGGRPARSCARIRPPGPGARER